MHTYTVSVQDTIFSSFLSEDGIRMKKEVTHQIHQSNMAVVRQTNKL